MADPLGTPSAISDTFAIRSLKRKKAKGLKLEPPPPSQAQTSQTQSSPLGVTVEFRLDAETLDVAVYDVDTEDVNHLRDIGESNGTVVRAVLHVPTDTIMIQKILHVEAKSDIRKRIVRELRTMHDCNSEYIVSFYGASVNSQGDIALYMEYMDVGTLDSIVKAFGPIRVDVLGKISQAVAGGLNYLYASHRIMHRDVRPSNILVNSSGRIKLSDFGVSGELMNSIADTVVGTNMYMSPERIMGARYTIKGDVWSFGITLLGLAIGEFPYSNCPGILDLLQEIVHEPSPKVPDGGNFPTAFAGMIDKCLMKDPKDRPTPQELYENDPFIAVAKNRFVDLAAWAASVHTQKKKLPGWHIPEPASLNRENDVSQQALDAPDESKTQSDTEKLTMDALLGQLHVMSTLELSPCNKEDSLRFLCNRCDRLLSAQPWKTGQRNAWEIQADGKELECSFCRLVNDCIPPVVIPPSSDVDHASRPPGGNHIVLQVGQLAEHMDRTIVAGSLFEDRDTGSQCAFQIAAAWMTACLTTHGKCIAARSLRLPVLPTRIIDVGPPDGSQNPRLHSGGSDRALYFTLSYRWAPGNTHVQTVTSNLETYREAIPLETLPQTMQDAVLITRKFAVRYLWIDALCIIQDSESDWYAEAKDMARIYSNSLLTITAGTDASEDSIGCFKPRSRLQARPLSSGSQWPDGATRYIFADRRATGDGARPLSTLDTRAWVLQEQILSPRVLRYSKEELYWDCMSLNASETFPGGIPSFYDASMDSLELRLFKGAISGTGRPAISNARFYTSWRKVVEEYSGRGMTKETDKLTALEGVAREAAFHLRDEPLAGLWKSRLWKDLLWWVKDPTGCTRPEIFAAPSWSWASLNGRISYTLLGQDGDDDIKQCVEISAVEVDADQTLPQLTGKITARGEMVPLLRPEVEGAHGSGSPGSVLATRWREDIEGTDQYPIRCLLIAVSNDHVYGLGLVPVVGTELHYKRIGMAVWRTSGEMFGWNRANEAWQDGVVLESVVII